MLPNQNGDTLDIMKMSMDVILYKFILCFIEY